MGDEGTKMATCGDIYCGEWDEDEELASGLAQFVATTLNKDAKDVAQYDEKAKELSTKREWTGLIDLFMADVPQLLNQLIGEDGGDVSTANGVLSVLFNICQKVSPNDLAAYWTKLAEAVVQPSVSHASASIRLQLLLDTFNSIPTSATRARHAVFCVIMDFAAANELVAVLAPQLDAIESRTETWGLPVKERRQLHMKIATALKSAGDSAMTFKFIVKYLSLFEAADEMVVAFPLAIEAAVIAIQDPVQHDCAQLLRLAAVVALKSASGKEASAHRLLEIFGSEKLASYQEFVSANKSAVADLGLDHESCVEKMRMLSLVNLATECSEIPYSTVAETLQIKPEEVEPWVIRVSRAGLVKTRMNQLREVVVVSRTKVRVFNNNDWAQLGTQVGAWKDSLTNLQSMIREAKCVQAEQ